MIYQIKVRMARQAMDELKYTPAGTECEIMDQFTGEWYKITYMNIDDSGFVVWQTTDEKTAKALVSIFQGKIAHEKLSSNEVN